jgi:lipid A ethanolaminephosphotransferase
MLHGLDQRLAALDPAAPRARRGAGDAPDGQPWAGVLRSARPPDQQAVPAGVPEQSRLSDCPREQLVSAYDNTIAYTDHFLGLDAAVAQGPRPIAV